MHSKNNLVIDATLSRKNHLTLEPNPSILLSSTIFKLRVFAYASFCTLPLGYFAFAVSESVETRMCFTWVTFCFRIVTSLTCAIFFVTVSRSP
jgi:hypothetical protein